MTTLLIVLAVLILLANIGRPRRKDVVPVVTPPQAKLSGPEKLSRAGSKLMWAGFYFWLLALVVFGLLFVL